MKCVLQSLSLPTVCCQRAQKEISNLTFGGHQQVLQRNELGCGDASVCSVPTRVRSSPTCRVCDFCPVLLRQDWMFATAAVMGQEKPSQHHMDGLRILLCGFCSSGATGRRTFSWRSLFTRSLRTRVSAAIFLNGGVFLKHNDTHKMTRSTSQCAAARQTSS